MVRFEFRRYPNCLIQFRHEVLDAQERRSIAIKFLKASSWNKELATYAARFTERRDQLSFGLDIRTAVNVEEIKSQIGSIETYALPPYMPIF
jgi:hypothetical protein